MNQDNKKLSVQEALDRLITEIAERIGWKPLKSQRAIKKVVGELVFQLNFYTSKWNLSYERIEMECEGHFWCKSFDKKSSYRSSVGYYGFKPESGSWWNITDEAGLHATVEKLCEQINETIIPLVQAFENDFTEAAKSLANKETFDKFHIRLEFIDVYAGRECIMDIAKDYYDSLSDALKEDIPRYKQGARDKSWMINPSNLKYIVDNEIV